MFELKLMTKEGKEFAPIFFEDLESAMKAFADNNKIGLQCALYNFK